MPGKPYTETEFIKKFWSRVDKISDPQGCWLWTGCKASGAYGHVWYNGKMEKSHRMSYLLSGKTIPEGLELAHSEYCVGKKHCCNPDHLTPKTRSENARDRWRDGTMIYKLTEKQVDDIKTRTDKNQAELAKEYNVSFQLISQIINGVARIRG